MTVRREDTKEESLIMKPIGPLMIEHRLIERMIKLVRDGAEAMEKTGAADITSVYTAIDFIETYADRCHHGKEENILFSDLNNRQLSAEHKRILNELLEEHTRARSLTRSLEEAAGRYERGDKSAAREIASFMLKLSDFYPAHIAKEDKNFFLPCMDYFEEKEQAKMLEEFWEFDRMLIHEKYRKVVEHMEKQ